MSNYRSFYGCRALNITSLNNKMSNLSGFISGVQNFQSNLSQTYEELLDVGGLEKPLLRERNEVSASMDRVIDRSGNFFVKKNAQIFNELGSNDGKCPLYNIVFYLGRDDKPIVSAGDITSVGSITNACPTSIEYKIGLRAPSITETVSFEAIKMEYGDDIENVPSFLPAPETGNLFKRTDYFSHKHPNTPSALPSLVTELIDYNNDERVFEGLQEISISIPINYSDFPDVGTWNLNDPYKHRYFSLPLQIETTFTINVKRYFANSAVNSPLFDDNEIKIEYGGFTFDLGPKNRLSDFSLSGGGTDGSIEQVTLTYVNNNVFKIQQREL